MPVPRFCGRLLLLSIFLFFCVAAPIIASSPRLNSISPRGVQRGAEHTLRFSGSRLADAQQVFLYDPVGVEILEIIQVDANSIDVKIRVAADCRLGEHVAQVRTLRGISDYRSFYVGALPAVAEAEPNNSIDAPQKIEQNVTVTGVVQNEDVDYYGVTCTKGQRLSIEIEAIRLGIMFDSFISLVDSKRFELASSDDSSLGNQDGLISVTIPEDGDYYVVVREASYGGNGGSQYRLHVGPFPRPTVVYPAGGPKGKEIDISFIGDPTGPINQKLTVQDTQGFRDGLFVSDDHGITPSPISFRPSDFENAMETEPNNTWTEVAPVALPIAFNGIIETANDHDYHRFSATKGQAWDVHCYARRIKSGLDPVINIYNATTKANVVGDDDARRPDCYLRFTAPEDGDYFVRVKDHLNRGQADFVYRVEITSPKPAVTFTIPRIDRYSQQRQQIAVPKGNRFATLFNAGRYSFGGELVLLQDNLPAGITLIAKPMAANLNSMPVVFEATAEAELSGALVDLKGRHADEAQNITGGFSNLADFALGTPNNARYYGCSVERLAIAVVEKIPYKLEMVQPKVPLVRDGSVNLKILVHRDEGFDGPITLQFPFRSPGVGTVSTVSIPQGATEGVYPLNASGNAQLGKWPVYCLGNGDVAGPAWASTQLAELEIAEPFVTMEMKRSSVELGSAGSLYCKINHNTPFEGEATAEILGLPPNIVIPPLTFTKDTPELTFQIETNEKSPVGKHTSLFCRITITKDGEPIVSTAGRSELQITKPRKPVVAAAAKPAPAAKPAAPVAKPKSRLQQLREAAQNSGQKDE